MLQLYTSYWTASKPTKGIVFFFVCVCVPDKKGFHLLSQDSLIQGPINLSKYQVVVVWVCDFLHWRKRVWVCIPLIWFNRELMPSLPLKYTPLPFTDKSKALKCLLLTNANSDCNWAQLSLCIQVLVKEQFNLTKDKLTNKVCNSFNILLWPCKKVFLSSQLGMKFQIEIWVTHFNDSLTSKLESFSSNESFPHSKLSNLS